ncbi:hypothetical protein NW762_008858 [Fusarium torreyae]|uniref:Uncharacterized protein n=1 Tax=Fusarium torreyae TaxID=1237075 RepID=A0A9W8RWJ2_9HYPO|nr:hypothetical protein NW762_008858 [Fusarium torreyae]
MQLQGDFTDRCPICCRKLDESEPKATHSTHHSTLPLPETSDNAPDAVPAESMVAKEKIERLMKRVRFSQQEHHSAEETDTEDGTDTRSASLTNPDSLTVNSATDLMMKHIATHLQSLALLTPRLASSEFEEGETRDFASSEGPSSSRTLGQRSTIEDDTEHVDFGDTYERASSPVITPPVIKNSNTKPPVRETSDATEPMNWEDLLSAAPYDEKEDDNINHMKKTKMSELNRLFSALLDGLQAPDYSVEAEASGVIQSQRSRLLDIQRSGSNSANRSIAFCSAAKGISFETLQSFFKAALSLQDRGQHDMLVDYCAEQVWVSHSYQDEDLTRGRRSATNSRRILFSLLVLADRPLDVLWFVRGEITDLDIPLSWRTLQEVIPHWTEKEISHFTFLQNLPAPLNFETVNIITSSFHSRDGRHDDFIRYVDQNLQEGLDGDGHKAQFISPSITQAWWKKPGGNRIPRAVDYSIHARPATILNGYLNIFSILVYIGRTSLINWFIRHNCQDQQLPILDPLRFGNDPTLVGMMTEFCNIQWMFCPIIFSSDTPMDKRSLDRRQILPIKEESTKISKAHNPESVIRVVTLHPGCYDQIWSPTVGFTPLSLSFFLSQILDPGLASP